MDSNVFGHKNIEDEHDSVVKQAVAGMRQSPSLYSLSGIESEGRVSRSASLQDLSTVLNTTNKGTNEDSDELHAIEDTEARSEEERSYMGSYVDPEEAVDMEEEGAGTPRAARARATGLVGLFLNSVEDVASMVMAAADNESLIGDVPAVQTELIASPLPLQDEAARIRGLLTLMVYAKDLLRNDVYEVSDRSADQLATMALGELAWIDTDGYLATAETISRRLKRLQAVRASASSVHYYSSFTLAFCAGCVDVTLLLRTSYATSHMTGNLVRSAQLTSSIFLLLCLFFALGAGTFGLMNKRRELFTPLLYVIAGLVALVWLLLHQGDVDDYVVLLAAYICGLQNALSLSYRGVLLRTTHVTGLFTDLGVLIGMRLGTGDVPTWKIGVLTSLLFSFFFGAMLSMLLWNTLNYHTLWIPVVLYLLVATIKWEFPSFG